MGFCGPAEGGSGMGRGGGRSMSILLLAAGAGAFLPLEPRDSPRCMGVLAAVLVALFLVGVRSGVDRRAEAGLGLVLEAFFWDDFATVLLVSRRQPCRQPLVQEGCRAGIKDGQLYPQTPALSSFRYTCQYCN